MLYSRPALAILAGKGDEWKNVLRKLGQILYMISPDPSIVEYEECHKICVNQSHFLNSYLFVNKASGKKPSYPTVETSRVLQRISVLSMSAFLLTRYLQMPPHFTFLHLKICEKINQAIQDIIVRQGKGKMNILHALGFEIALRNWIKEKTGSLKIHEKKIRGKKDVEQLRTQLLQIENNMRNFQKSVKTRLDDMQEQVRKLQDMQTWFSLNKVLLSDLLYGSPGKNSEAENFAQNENDEEKDELSEADDEEIEDEQKNEGNIEDGETEAREEETKELEGEEEDAEEEESAEEGHSPLLFTESERENEEEESDNDSEE